MQKNTTVSKLEKFKQINLESKYSYFKTNKIKIKNLYQIKNKKPYAILE